MWDSDLTLVSGSSGCGSTMSSATPISKKGLQYVSKHSQRLGKDEGNRRAWGHEISKKINEYDGTFEGFLRDFVPSQKKYKYMPQYAKDAFEGLLSDDVLANEKNMYDPLVRGPLFVPCGQ